MRADRISPALIRAQIPSLAGVPSPRFRDMVLENPTVMEPGNVKHPRRHATSTTGWPSLDYGAKMSGRGACVGVLRGNCPV